MTVQRYIYKLCWGKFGVAILLGCSLLALITTLHQHKHFELQLNPGHVTDVALRERNNVGIAQSHTTSFATNSKADAKKASENSAKALPEQSALDVEGNQEIELADAFWNDLKKPHIHIDGDINALEEKAIQKELPVNSEDKIPLNASNSDNPKRILVKFVETKDTFAKPVDVETNDSGNLRNVKKDENARNEVWKLIEAPKAYGDVKEDNIHGIGEEDYDINVLPTGYTKRKEIKPNRKRGLYYNPTNPPKLFEEWRTLKYSTCKDTFVAYTHEFAILHQVVLDKTKFFGKAGGEEIREVLNQDEKIEYYRYELGCFKLKCRERPDYYFNNGHHLQEYLFNMKTSDVDITKYNEIVTEFTIVVTRYEYVNLYHTMTDWYNAFLLMNFFNRSQEETSILFIDAHPKGALDSAWGVLFKSAKRLSQLKPKTLYTDMVWSTLGYNSLLLNHYTENIPLIEEFRDFFLRSFDIERDHSLNCEKPNILFIWRHNYLAHPRNPSGTISRKIRNERTLLNAVRRRWKQGVIRGVQIDLFSMELQLGLIGKADILIGMHGAGLTHAIFLPKHAALIELVPSYWGVMDHFSAIAQWRGLVYERWVNMDWNIEILDKSTRVPPSVVTGLIQSALIKMQCMEADPKALSN